VSQTPTQPNPSTQPTRPAGAIRKRYDRQVRYGRVLGLLFTAAGFAVIGFGWNGAAKTAFVDVQFPYLISGGAGGLALVLLGMSLLLLTQFRAERIKLGEQLEHVGAVLTKAMSATVGAGSSTNGMVVAGRSTYHRPDCRLVQGKSDLDLVPVEAAKLEGLSPCRVCNPTAEDAAPAAERASSGGRRRGSRKR
jgi:hypothetical protein